MLTGRALRRLASAAAALRPAPDPGSIVAVCHCHHADLVPELAEVLGRLPPSAALHVTSSRADVLETWRARAAAPSRPILHRVENRGRDLKPFFEVLRGLRVPPDALILKVHGKRSDYTGHGASWRRDLLDGLLPDRRAPGRLAQRFRDDPRLGLAGAPGSFIGHPVYWGGNRPIVARIMGARFGAPPGEGDLAFFAGSMFWMRGALLADLAPLVDLDAFEPEPLSQDGGYAHAVERVIGMAALRLGWRVEEVGRPAPLDAEMVRDRKIPYI